jgi:hypothetical protein
LLDFPEGFVLVGGEELSWVADGDPADRYDGAWFEAGVDLQDAPAPASEPGNNAAPVAMKTSSSTVAPFTWACGPTRTASPISAGWSARPRTRAFSITTLFSPRWTSPFSAVSTAPCNTLLPSPSTTAPQSTADGATYADSGTIGR